MNSLKQQIIDYRNSHKESRLILGVLLSELDRDDKIKAGDFRIDDLNPNPHEADIQMLLRQCRVHNVPVACNRSTADFIISSNLWNSDYKATKPIYKEYDRTGNI